jgi:hypothetical protein
MIIAIVLIAIVTRFIMPVGMSPVTADEISNDGREVALALSKGLIKGIDSGVSEGDARPFTVQMNLQGGNFAVTDVSISSSQIWRVKDTTRIRIDFWIEGKKVKNPVVTFSTAASDTVSGVTIEPTGSANPKESVVPISIAYGTALVANDMYEPEGPNDVFQFAKKHLSISSDPSFIFEGNPFRLNARYLETDPADPLKGSPLVNEVIFPAVPEGAEVNVPPVLVGFKNNTALRLATKNEQNQDANTLTLTGESKAKLSRYRYDARNKQIYQSWSNLELHLAAGSLNAGGFSLPMANGLLILDRLRILSSSLLGVSTDEPNVAVLAEKAEAADSPSNALDANLAGGAAITFGNSVSLVSSSETHLSFRSLRFSFSSGPLIALSAQGISSSKMKLLEARFGFGDRGNLRLGPSSDSAIGARLVELKLVDGSGRWTNSVTTPVASDAFQLAITDVVAAPVLSGKLVFFPGKPALEIDRGSFVTASDLRLSPESGTRGVAGTFTGVTLKLKSYGASPIDIDSVVKAEFGPDLTLTSEAANPLRIQTDKKGVVGRFNIQGTYPVARIQADAPLELRSLNGGFEVRSDGEAARAVSIDISSSSITSAKLSFDPVGGFDLSSGALAGDLTLDEQKNRFTGSLKLTNFQINSGMLRLTSATGVNVSSVGTVPRGVVDMGLGTPNKVQVQTFDIRLAARAPARIPLKLILLEGSADMLLSATGMTRFDPQTQFMEGNYTLTGSGIVRLAEGARIPLELSPGRVEMNIDSSAQTGAGLKSFSAEGAGKLVSGTTSVPLYLKLSDGKYAANPENITASLEIKFRQPSGPAVGPKFGITSFAPPRSNKNQPKLFPVNFNWFFGQDTELKQISVRIDQNGLSSTDAAAQTLLLSAEVLSGNGIYKYDGKNLGTNDKPQGRDTRFDGNEDYKPFRFDQQMLWIRLPDSDCKAGSMVGTQAVFQTPVTARLSILQGSLRLDFADQVVGPVPASPAGTTLLLRDCSNSQHGGPATAAVMAALENYIRQNPLLGQGHPIVLQPAASAQPKQSISKLLTISIVEALNGQSPRFPFTLGTPRP